MKTPSASLVHVLIGKSILETLLVGALALFTFMSVVPPFFHGWGEATDHGIEGWAVNDAAPWERIEVHLYVDGKFRSVGLADQARPDVLAAGWSKDEWHGYSFPIQGLPAGPHEARVYALHESGGGLRKSLQLLGDPIVFEVGGNGQLKPKGH